MQTEPVAAAGGGTNRPVEARRTTQLQRAPQLGGKMPAVMSQGGDVLSVVDNSLDEGPGNEGIAGYLHRHRSGADDMAHLRRLRTPARQRRRVNDDAQLGSPLRLGSCRRAQDHGSQGIGQSSGERDSLLGWGWPMLRCPMGASSLGLKPIDHGGADLGR